MSPRTYTFTRYPTGPEDYLDRQIDLDSDTLVDMLSAIIRKNSTPDVLRGKTNSTAQVLSVQHNNALHEGTLTQQVNSELGLQTVECKVWHNDGLYDFLEKPEKDFSTAEKAAINKILLFALPSISLKTKKASEEGIDVGDEAEVNYQNIYGLQHGQISGKLNTETLSRAPDGNENVNNPSKGFGTPSENG